MATLVTVRYLSKHSEDPRFKEAAEKIYRSLRRVATSEGLLPTLLNVATGEGKGSSYSAGAYADSYYEYLLKVWIQGGKKDEVGMRWCDDEQSIRKAYVEGVEGITRRLMKRGGGGLLFVGEQQGIGPVTQEMGHLTCFIGGMLALGVFHGANPKTAERDMANAKALA